MENNNQNLNDNQNDRSKDNTTNSPQSVATYHNSAFSSNVFYGFAKRAERIATAVYMVSNFVTKDGIALKNDMRKYGLRMTKDLYKCITGDTYDQQYYLEETLVSIEYIITTMSVANSVGMISTMNKEVLEKALHKLGSQVYAQLQVILRYEKNESMEMTPGVNKETLLDFLQGAAENSIDTDQDFQQIMREAIDKKKTFNTTQNDTFLKRQTKRQTPPETTQTSSTSSDRRKKIQAIIIEKGEVTIKDIATRITNCSEKTLQRDLVQLIKDNVVEKDGDKRWSVYRIKDNS